MPPRVKQFVDDLHQRAEGTASRVRKQLVEAAVYLGKALVGRELDISVKTTVVAPTKARATEIRDAIMEQMPQLRFKVDTSAKDVGLDYAGGEKHARVARNKRGRAAFTRAKLIRKKFRKRKIRTLLFNTGPMAQLRYGVTLHGTPPTVLKKIRAAMVANFTGATGRHLCATTLLRLHAPGKDPEITMRLELLREWLRLWIEEPFVRKRSERAWAKARLRVDAAPARRWWHRVPGPLTAVILALREAGWEAEGPVAWRDPRGDLWAIPNPAPEAIDAEAFLAKIAADIERKQWHRAATKSNL